MSSVNDFKDALDFNRVWRGWGFKEGKTKHKYMKDKKEKYLRRKKKTKDIKKEWKESFGRETVGKLLPGRKL